MQKQMSRSAVISMFVLALAASSHAVVTETDQSADFAAGSTGYQANVPAVGVNLLALPGTTVTPSGAAPATPSLDPDRAYVGTSSSWSTLTDGSVGTVQGWLGDPGEVYIHDNWTLTYTFDSPRTIGDMDVFTRWSDGGRRDPRVTIKYSTDGITFTSLHAINYAASGNCAWVHLTGILVPGVVAVQFAFGAQQNSAVGYAELCVQSALSTKDMQSFTFPSFGAATITGTNITMTVPYGTDVTALAPTYTHNGTSCSPASGSSQNFTSPVHYIVTAGDSSTQDYTVTVTVAPATKDMLTFTFPSLGAATITGTNITIAVPYGTDVTALAPTYTHNGDSCVPASGSSQNFTSPVQYIVTGADSGTKDYLVTVIVKPEAPVTINLAYMNTMDGTYYWQQAGSASQAAPLAYAGTNWNDGGNGSAAVSNLKKSDGTASGISVSAVLRPRATGVNWGSLLGGNKLASYPAGLGLGSVAGDSDIRNGFVDILTFSGLAANHSYNIVLADPGEWQATFKYLAQSAYIETKPATNNDWVRGKNYALLTNCVPNASGEITIQEYIHHDWSALCGWQILDNGTFGPKGTLMLIY
ncbi:MAG: hypothetical protein WCK89_13765 [bacterium]